MKLLFRLPNGDDVWNLGVSWFRLPGGSEPLVKHLFAGCYAFLSSSLLFDLFDA